MLILFAVIGGLRIHYIGEAARCGGSPRCSDCRATGVAKTRKILSAFASLRDQKPEKCKDWKVLQSQRQIKDMTTAAPTKTKYEAIIGLETHCQLNTNTKIFSSSSTEFVARIVRSPESPEPKVLVTTVEFWMVTFSL